MTKKTILSRLGLVTKREHDRIVNVLDKRAEEYRKAVVIAAEESGATVVNCDNFLITNTNIHGTLIILGDRPSFMGCQITTGEKVSLK